MDTLTKDPNEGLLKALQCPRCKNYMVPPISFCENGHNICNNCKPKLNRCPECKEPFLRGTNLMLENVARQVEYPCIYRKNGCPETFPVHLILEHQEDCPFGPYNCPVILAGRRRCPWKGPLVEMKCHLQENHKEETWEGTGVFSKKQLMVSSSGLYNNVMLTCGEIFYVHFRGEKGLFYGFVKYIGPKCNAKDFRYEISITSKDMNEMVMARYMVHSYKEGNEDIIEYGKCLKLNYDVVKKFLDDESSMDIKIEVSKIEQVQELQQQ